MTRRRVALALLATAVAVPGLLIAVDSASARRAEEHPLRILLTNDDGPTASGAYLTDLRDALCTAGHAVTVVVPSTDQSGNGTRITGKGTLSAATSTFACGSGQGTQYAVSASTPANASPADAVLFGLKVVFAGGAPDLVVSGMNPGGNFGRVTNHSGTVGAAVTAIEQGVPGIAVSIEYDAVDATRGFAGAAAARPVAAKFVAGLITELRKSQPDKANLLPEGGLNINWPVAYDSAGPAVVPPKGAELTRIGTGEAIVLGYQSVAGGQYTVVAGICGLPAPCAAETRDHADTTARRQPDQHLAAGRRLVRRPARPRQAAEPRAGALTLPQHDRCGRHRPVGSLPYRRRAEGRHGGRCPHRGDVHRPGRLH